MNDPTGLIIGFVPTSVKDFNDISTLVKLHKIKPVIILDCSLEEDVLRDMVKEVIDKKYEVVLSGMTFNGSVLDMSDEIKDLLVKSGYDKELAFFLRKDYSSDKNRNLLKEHDYENYILYNEQLQAGVLETGNAYICYGFYRKPEQLF